MTQEEHDEQKRLIIEQFGQPEFDMNEPVNESGKKLKELKIAFAKSKEDTKKAIKLEANVKELVTLLPKLSTPVNDEVIRPEWLVAFSTELQRSIVKQWAKNINASNDAIGVATGTTASVVRNTKSLDAFKMLQRHLTLATKEQAALNAMLALTGLLQSKFDNIRLKAAELLLVDQGYLRDSQSDKTEINNNIVHLTPEKEAELNAYASQLVRLSKKTQ